MTNADIAAQWIKKANDDLIVAHHVFENIHPKQLDICCYHCQQASEKALKAVLIFHEAVDEIPYTHNLKLLLSDCLPLHESFEALNKDCAALTPYATQTRYPGNKEITEKETAAALQKAERIVNFCACLIAPN